MKQAIDELKTIPGVTGACLLSQGEGLSYNNLPGIFREEKLNEVGRQIAKLLAASRMSFTDMRDVGLYYEESVIVAREMSRGQVLFVICDAAFNQNLLTMSLNLLQEDMQAGQPAAVSPTVSAAAAPTPAAAVSPQAQAGEDLSEQKEELQQALAKAIGPMATIVFDEIYHDWSSAGVAGRSRLAALVAQLRKEISDPARAEAFERQVAHLI